MPLNKETKLNQTNLQPNIRALLSSIILIKT